MNIVNPMYKDLLIFYFNRQGTFWHGNILLVIAIENRYQVYIEKQSDEQEQSVHLIEKIPMYGHHKKVVLFPDRDNLYCLIESTFMGQENG